MPVAVDEHLDRRDERRLLVAVRRMLDHVLPASVGQVGEIEPDGQRVPLGEDLVRRLVDEPELKAAEALVEQVPALVRDR